MKKYIGNKKYISCDELARTFSNDYGVKISMEDIHRLVDPYCRKHKGSLKKINGEWFYDSATIWQLRCYGNNAVEFVNKIKLLGQHVQTEDELEYNPFFDQRSVDRWYRPNKINEDMNTKSMRGLWLDDLRNDPYTFLAKKDDKSESGEVVRNWYNQNMADVDIQWYCVSNFEQFKNYIETNGVPDFVSLDHDLGRDKTNQQRKGAGLYVATGADCALFLVSYCVRNGIPIPPNYNHSANDNKRVFIAKAFRLGRMGKDPMEGVNLDNEQEFIEAANRFRSMYMNPNVGRSVNKFLKKNDVSQLGAVDRLAKMRGFDNPNDIFDKTSYRENRKPRQVIRLTESDLHRIILESVDRILRKTNLL